MLPWSRSRPVRALCAALLAALAVSGLPAARAHAADHTVSGGRLDWGIKASFQSYVTGPIANGSWSLQGGAATVGDSQFRFHSATGSYDPDSGAFRAGFSGGVRFLGHEKADGGHEMDLTIARPTVRVDGGNGTLYADMTSKEKGTGKVTSAAQVPLATLDLSGVDMRGGGSTVQLATIPATLTAQGAKSFAGYYTEGTRLDPVTLSADVLAGRASPSAEPKPKDSAKDGKKNEPAEPRGEFTDAAVDWGVRRTFREYVTGSIAQGRWELSEGARDGGALFRFTAGKGSYDAERQRLDATFQGRLRFQGEDLDLALSGVTVRVEDGKGTLAADVAGTALTRRDVPLATFDVGRPKPEDGLITVAEAPATLTADGAKAFGGMYRAGTAMDPISLAVAVTEGAELPPLPDLGAAPTDSPRPKATDTTPKPAASSSDSSDSPSTPVVLAAVGAAVLAAAAAGLLLLRGRRAAAAGGSAAPDPDDSTTNQS
ncbi:HtaA domain-containing protein [Streptomyces sp. SAJ15]|uniref:HtaA domain-containing protein n=1 Tax=Streptomyces sp. SAJ15 TaxID=2011095 RepID=UPI001184D591|nr:HtaA domain-containing protein [Streptomyces sp. SAJ15]TVL89962.1 Htaa domain protein [Streptomyces sp. SAJ15]